MLMTRSRYFQDGAYAYRYMIERSALILATTARHRPRPLTRLPLYKLGAAEAEVRHRCLPPPSPICRCFDLDSPMQRLCWLIAK
jgi:hypothetical protein